MPDGAVMQGTFVARLYLNNAVSITMDFAREDECKWRDKLLETYFKIISCHLHEMWIEWQLGCNS
jgi:hypothetical protein